MSIKPGTLATDILTGDSIFIIESTDKRADEQVVMYDYNKNPITLYEVEKEKDYECTPEDEAFEVAYPDRLETLTDTRTPDIEAVKNLIEKQKVKPYYFSEKRIKEE